MDPDEIELEHKLDSFKKELAFLVNKYSLENQTDTPDYVIADYLVRCLRNWNTTYQEREKWYYNLDNSNTPQEYDGSMDGDAQSALASAGWGTDEDYGGIPGEDHF